MKFGIAVIVFLAIASALTSLTLSETPNIGKPMDVPLAAEQAVELGAVHWLTDFAAAQDASLSSGKPIFAMFQNLSGKKQCRVYGQTVLAHPLIVEAIETAFVPLAVDVENESGELKKNFPASFSSVPGVRYLASNGSELIPYKDGTKSIEDTIDRMSAALTAANQSVPKYLELAKSPNGAGTEVAEFAMFCYWEGEAKLGSIPGVHSTRSGWRNGYEVVQLHYSPDTVDYTTLLKTAQSFNCATKVFTHTDSQQQMAKQLVGSKSSRVTSTMRDAKASDQKYYLAHTTLKHVPLTEIQATKLNAAAKSNGSVDEILSPRQIEIARRVSSALGENRNALSGFHRPDEPNQLGAYQNKLIGRLKELGHWN